MPIISEESIRKDIIRDIACQMMAAARTAPKAKGRDTLLIALAEGETVEQLAAKMEEIAERDNARFFARDASNVRQSGIVVFIGTRIESCKLPACGYCGFENCANKDKQPDVPCVLNTVDLGIAIGSAVDTAMACKVDNRVMFSVGRAALELGLFDSSVKILFGIPLSISAKSPFFDRQL